MSITPLWTSFQIFSHVPPTANILLLYRMPLKQKSHQASCQVGTLISLQVKSPRSDASATLCRCRPTKTAYACTAGATVCPVAKSSMHRPTLHYASVGLLPLIVLLFRKKVNKHEIKVTVCPVPPSPLDVFSIWLGVLLFTLCSLLDSRRRIRVPQDDTSCANAVRSREAYF